MYKEVALMNDIYVGAIALFPYNFELQDWMACEGQLCSIHAYQELFALIGTTYGGDGVNHFALPNLLGTEPMPMMKFQIALKGLFPTRE